MYCLFKHLVMKYLYKIFITTVFLYLTVNCSYGQPKGNLKNYQMSTNKIEIKNLINSISMSRWKYDANSCTQFSFDDNLKTHSKISKIFDLYNYKASFFVISLNILTDSVKDIYSRGHEIGNHTFDHAHPLSTLDSTAVDFEIRKGKEGIENLLGKKCVDEADPWHAYNANSKSVLFKYELFGRDYTQDASYVFFGVEDGMTIDKFTTYFLNGIKTKGMMPICAHGLIGEGYGQISESMLKQVLDTVKIHADKGETWMTTTLEGEFYDNLYHEISLKSVTSNDTLFITAGNYNKNKYKDIPTSPISITITNQPNIQLSCISNNVDIRKFTGKSVYTFDLQRDTVLALKIEKSPDITTNLKNDTIIHFYPNPVSNYLFMQYDGDISFVEVFDLQGNLVLLDNSNTKRINMTMLKPGVYVVKVFATQNSSTEILRNKFLKI